MTRFEQEEKWFQALIQHIEDHTRLKVVTSMYEPALFPCLYVEKHQMGGRCNHLSGEITLSLLTEYEGCKEESNLAKRVMQVCEDPILLHQGSTSFKLLKQGRKSGEKKVRQLSLFYQVFVSLPLSGFQKGV